MKWMRKEKSLKGGGKEKRRRKRKGRNECPVTPVSARSSRPAPHRLLPVPFIPPGTGNTKLYYFSCCSPQQIFQGFHKGDFKRIIKATITLHARVQCVKVLVFCLCLRAAAQQVTRCRADQIGQLPGQTQVHFEVITLLNHLPRVFKG